ncbi:MAG: ArsA family ATPase [Oligoflexia bacterium]|nr:ArsA family ATPase [Oligoflexia bacterium]
MNLAQKKLIFVTGKGGVGKSVVAASIAVEQAKLGKKVCLVELGGQSFYESFFETRGITYEPSEVIPLVHISLLTPDESLREFVTHYLKIPKLYEILFQNRIMKAFLSAAPALSEISILGKLTSDIREVIVSEYDVIVCDTYSTGHALALLRAPIGLSQTFKVGPLKDHAMGIHNVICDPSKVHYVLVTIPEELPLKETLEMFDTLKKEFKADVDVVCNLIYSSELNSAEKTHLKTELKEQDAVDFLEYVIQKEGAQHEHLKQLTNKFPQIYGIKHVFKDFRGQELLDTIVPQLERPWFLTNS